MAVFNELIQQPAHKGPDWLTNIFLNIQNWPVKQVQDRIEQIDAQMKKHPDVTIDPLAQELSEMEEEQRIREALGMKE